MLHRIESVEVRDGYRLWIRFEDGAEGEVDLSDVAGKGVFAAWDDPAVFGQVCVDELSGTLTWPGGLDVAPDRLYHEVVGEPVGKGSNTQA